MKIVPPNPWEFGLTKIFSCVEQAGKFGRPIVLSEGFGHAKSDMFTRRGICAPDSLNG